nr:MAG TPA: hypothetical protein [Caudoviricetes sp.]
MKRNGYQVPRPASDLTISTAPPVVMQRQGVLRARGRCSDRRAVVEEPLSISSPHCYEYITTGRRA